MIYCKYYFRFQYPSQAHFCEGLRLHCIASLRLRVYDVISHDFNWSTNVHMMNGLNTCGTHNIKFCHAFANAFVYIAI